MKTHIMFMNDGKAFVTEKQTLEAARHEEAVEGGGDPSDIIAHVPYEGTGGGLEAILSVHALAINGNKDSDLEGLAQAIFDAGVKYGRENPT